MDEVHCSSCTPTQHPQGEDRLACCYFIMFVYLKDMVSIALFLGGDLLEQLQGSKDREVIWCQIMQICDISGIHCCVNYNTVLLDLEFWNVTQSKCSMEYCQYNHEVCFKASASDTLFFQTCTALCRCKKKHTISPI